MTATLLSDSHFSIHIPKQNKGDEQETYAICRILCHGLPGGYMFSTEISLDNNIDMPYAIIDSRFCRSVDRRKTHDEKMCQLGTDEINDKEISQHKHLFRPSNKPLKAICVVRLPFF